MKEQNIRFDKPDKHRYIFNVEHKLLFYMVCVTQDINVLIAKHRLIMDKLKQLITGCVIVAKDEVLYQSRGFDVTKAKGGWKIILCVVDTHQARSASEVSALKFMAGDSDVSQEYLDTITRIEEVKRKEGQELGIELEKLYKPLETIGQGYIDVKVDLLYWDKVVSLATSNFDLPTLEKLLEKEYENSNSDFHKYVNRMGYNYMQRLERDKAKENTELLEDVKSTKLEDHEKYKIIVPKNFLEYYTREVAIIESLRRGLCYLEQPDDPNPYKMVAVMFLCEDPNVFKSGGKIIEKHFKGKPYTEKRMLWMESDKDKDLDSDVLYGLAGDSANEEAHRQRIQPQIVRHIVEACATRRKLPPFWLEELQSTNTTCINPPQQHEHYIRREKHYARACPPWQLGLEKYPTNVTNIWGESDNGKTCLAIDIYESCSGFNVKYWLGHCSNQDEFYRKLRALTKNITLPTNAASKSGAWGDVRPGSLEHTKSVLTLIGTCLIICDDFKDDHLDVGFLPENGFRVLVTSPTPISLHNYWLPPLNIECPRYSVTHAVKVLVKITGKEDPFFPAFARKFIFHPWTINFAGDILRDEQTDAKTFLAQLEESHWSSGEKYHPVIQRVFRKSLNSLDPATLYFLRICRYLSKRIVPVYFAEFLLAETKRRDNKTNIDYFAEFNFAERTQAKKIFSQLIKYRFVEKYSAGYHGMFDSGPNGLRQSQCLITHSSLHEMLPEIDQIHGVDVSIFPRILSKVKEFLESVTKDSCLDDPTNLLHIRSLLDHAASLAGPTTEIAELYMMLSTYELSDTLYPRNALSSYLKFSRINAALKTATIPTVDIREIECWNRYSNFSDDPLPDRFFPQKGLPRLGYSYEQNNYGAEVHYHPYKFSAIYAHIHFQDVGEIALCYLNNFCYSVKTLGDFEDIDLDADEYHQVDMDSSKVAILRFCLKHIGAVIVDNYIYFNNHTASSPISLLTFLLKNTGDIEDKYGACSNEAQTASVRILTCVTLTLMREKVSEKNMLSDVRLKYLVNLANDTLTSVKMMCVNGMITGNFLGLARDDKCGYTEKNSYYLEIFENVLNELTRDLLNNQDQKQNSDRFSNAFNFFKPKEKSERKKHLEAKEWQECVKDWYGDDYPEFLKMKNSYSESIIGVD